MKVEVKIHPLTTADLPDLLSLWSLTDLPLRPNGRDSIDTLTRQLNDDHITILGAFSGPTLVGAVLLSHDGRKGWVNRLAVHPDLRRRGIARRLMAAGEDRFRQDDIGIISALIEEENVSSRTLFKDEGYEEIHSLIYLRKHLVEGA